MAKKLFSRGEVMHLANLAHVKLTEKEVAQYQKQLSETIAYIENLSEITHQHVEKKEKKQNVFFDDQTSPVRILSPDQALANTKHKKDQYFSVKKIM
ncbi:MAG TPA: Asp-tRNA(Asn)/Glu-tRNA(Gln) amidotransferase subunit GatC [Patescibacteria group bacterium]|nr:Asp-tRNA(Asn)/Glu-tRNA(Gln) amidotransferase subunit GatC [Patescibacteria group bacterium]